MELDYENGKPVLRMKDETTGVTITLEFADEPEQKDLKQVIMDMLAASYEQRVTA